jgi:hypothetical protein
MEGRPMVNQRRDFVISGSLRQDAPSHAKRQKRKNATKEMLNKRNNVKTK